MAKRKSRANGAQLQGADEFLGNDPEKEAIEKIAAARAEAEKNKSKEDNGGPILDQAAWRRATNESVAEDIEIGKLQEQIAECRGRLSSIRKVAKSCGVDWDVVSSFRKKAKRIRKGELGTMVTEIRLETELGRLMDCPLYTQFDIFKDASEAAATPKTEDQIIAEATLAGEQAGKNGEPKDNNPYWTQAGTPKWFGWNNGWQKGADALADSFAGKAPPAANGDAAH